MINKLNFIRWTGFGGAVSHTLLEAVLPIAYAKDIGRQFGPLFYPFEKYSFYLNFNTPIVYPAFNFLRLNIRRFSDGVTVAANIGTIIRDNIVGTTSFNMAFTINSFPNLQFGWYEFVLYRTDSSQIVAVSNPVEVLEVGDNFNVAKIFYRNSINRNNTNYEGLSTFYNILHLPLIQSDFNIEQDRQQYRNVTNRKLRNLKTYTDYVLKIESYNFDTEAHKAMAEVYCHDTVFINKTFIVPKDAYQIENRLNSVLSKASINVYTDEGITNPNL